MGGFLGSLGSFISPGLTAATQLATGAEQGQIAANQELLRREIEQRQIAHQQNMDNLTALIAGGRVSNYQSLVNNRGTGVTYKTDANGNVIALPRNMGGVTGPTSGISAYGSTDGSTDTSGNGSDNDTTGTLPPAGASVSSPGMNIGGSAAGPTMGMNTGIKAAVRLSPYSREAVAVDSIKALNRRKIEVNNPLPPQQSPLSTELATQRLQDLRDKHDAALATAENAFNTPQDRTGATPSAAARAALVATFNRLRQQNPNGDPRELMLRAYLASTGGTRDAGLQARTGLTQMMSGVTPAPGNPVTLTPSRVAPRVVDPTAGMDDAHAWDYWVGTGGLNPAAATAKVYARHTK